MLAKIETLDPLTPGLFGPPTDAYVRPPLDFRLSDLAQNEIAEWLNVDKSCVSSALDTIRAKAKRRKKPNPIDTELLINDLDGREKEVLEFTLQGFTQEEISKKLKPAVHQSRVSAAIKKIWAKSQLLPPGNRAPRASPWMRMA